jgi:hypothetical protein
MAVFMGESHPKPVIAAALLLQFLRDFDGRLAADIEEGYAEAVIDLVGQVRGYVQLGGIALDKHGNGLGWDGDRSKPQRWRSRPVMVSSQIRSNSALPSRGAD